METLAWVPSEAELARSRLYRFYRSLGLASLTELRERSAADPAWYWNVAVHDLGIRWQQPPTTVLDLSDGLPWARFFPDAHYNYVADILERWGSSNRPALIWEGDDGTTAAFAYTDLARLVPRLAAGLAALGVSPGDRIGIFLPMLPETALAVLAASWLGALVVPIFSGFGPDPVATRLQDAEATLVMTADAFPRRGRLIALKAIVDQALERCPSVQHVVVVRRTGTATSWIPGRDVWWHDLLEQNDSRAEPAVTGATAPCMLIYTSGTTGRPKGTVHVQAGFPIKAAHDLAYCFDVQPDDRVLWLTDLGWMMGPWLIQGTLLLGATVVLYEGTPDWPTPDRLWQLVSRHRITVLGLTPSVVRAAMARGASPDDRHDLSSLRAFGSTGEPWNPTPWWWLFETVGQRRVPIINYTGGTEIAGGILSCTTIEPQVPCAFTGPVPGMAADVVDDEGRPVRGQVGELVLRQPWVGMTAGFWRDPERYLATYWSRWPNMWVHGDWALIDTDGFWYILGRSDDTLKIAGKRLGPAEVESIAVSHPAVQEAAAIGIPDPVKGEALVVFCQLRQGVEPSAELLEEIRDRITERLGKPLRPERVHVVRELPRTRNAKIMRRVIRAVYLGQDPGDLSALENPAAVEEIAAIGRMYRASTGEDNER
ncbi:AMP-binding protein [Thermomicrobium sp. 4228-Ro]|uniref:AMP-binding protein n=1 Tax=Thermomicrobium sp. 4228-Ro TaxID=2993937 RepID=UPI0022490597|nr:AMP-binding protein [Thermomicrobium sp. 4228-Ro]MCX2727587.1 AMP-binding protein [Thermomicrobium sp. 4228-Ro]